MRPARWTNSSEYTWNYAGSISAKPGPDHNGSTTGSFPKGITDLIDVTLIRKKH